MDVLILCGGLGSRLRSEIGETQKVLAEVGQRPFLDILLEYLIEQNVHRVIFCSGYKSDQIEQYYQNKDCALPLEFSREKVPLGTGGAVKNAAGLIRSNPFLVVNGDSFCPLDIGEFEQFHLKKNALASIAVSEVKENKDFGSITMDSSGKIVEFKEKKKGMSRQYVSAGMYYLDQRIFKSMPKEKKFSLEEDFFPKLVDQKFYGFVTDKCFMDIGTPERYGQAQDFFKKGRNIEDKI